MISSNSTPLLKAIGLKKFFPVYAGVFRKHVADIQAVRGIDIEIHQGQVLGVVGESGCGKSTAGRALIRLIEPTDGQIFFDGEEITHKRRSQLKNFRKQVQIVFQDPYSSLNPRMTVGDSIGEGLLYNKLVKNKQEMRDRVAHILERVGLSSDAMYRYPHHFSGGGQQRICIARAIAVNPKLIVCDEAVSALDVSVQAQILNLLNDLKKDFELSYLFISHDLTTIKYFSDRVVVMYLGKIMEVANTEDLFKGAKHPYTRALLSAMPKTHPNEDKKRILLKGEIPSVIDPPTGCPFRTRCPYAQKECETLPPKRTVGDSTMQDHHYFCILDENYFKK